MDTFDTGFDKALDEAQGQSQDQAPEPTKEAEVPASVEQKVEEKPSEAAQPEGSEELLAQGEYDKLKDDPQALRKALNTAFTQKTQALAEQRKALEPYQGLIDRWNTDPQGTVRALAEQAGVRLEQVETKQEVRDATSEVVAELKLDLGPDLEFLADKLGPALERLIAREAGQAISKEVEPLKQQAQKMQEETVTQQIEANLEMFSDKHPDWRKYEAEMTKIGARFQPVATGKDSWMEYMETLYFLATKDGREGDIAKKTVERMKASAEKSQTSEGGVSGSKVTKAAPKGASFDAAFDQSWKDASAGVTYD
jgi:hypothetical protein